MNKTLLLILCDFLLLTILSMWRMEKDAPPPSPDETPPGAPDSVAAMAMMEQDLLDSLKFALEEEQSERSNLVQSLEEKDSELARIAEELQARESRIDNLQSTLTEAEQRELELQAERERLAREAEGLAAEVEQTRSTVTEVTTRLSETERQARQNEAQARLLQEELEQKLAEVQAKEAALAETSQRLQTAQQQVQELDTQVRMSQQENLFLQDSVSTLRTEIVSERQERQRLQEQTGALAEGVSQLATSSQDLRQELRSSIPINANQLFSDFKDNTVTAQFRAVVFDQNRFVEKNTSTATVLVSDGQSTYALMHIDNGPFSINTNPAHVRAVAFQLARQGVNINTNRIRFLGSDPRVVAIPLTDEQAERLGGKPYLTALEPFKFTEAVLVSGEGRYYGEVEFKLDSDTPGFVRMQTRVFSSLFGEFSPSTGDLVLSKTGELLGVMVNRRYCVLVNNFVPAASLELSGAVDTEELRRTLDVLRNMLRAYPGALR